MVTNIKHLEMFNQHFELLCDQGQTDFNKRLFGQT